VPNNFYIKEKVSSRQYEYILPLKLLYPYKDIQTLSILKPYFRGVKM